MGLLSGVLLDKGYFRVTLLLGSLLFVFSLFMVSIADRSKYYQLYLAQGLGMGIGGGLLYVPSLAVQGHHWRARRSLAMGIVVSGSSLGGLIFPIMLNKLFNGRTGFEWGVRASAFLVLALLVASNLLMTSRPPARAANAPNAHKNMKAILTDVPYMLFNLSSLLNNWGLFFPFFYLQLFAILHGIDSNIAFYTLAIMNGAAIPGRIVPNYFADRLGPFNLLGPVTLVCAALLFALFGVKDVAGTMMFAILFGFFSGAYLSLCAPCIASLARDPSEIGARFGPAYLISSLGALTGNPIAGALLGLTFPWWKPILFCSISSALALVIIVVTRNLVAARKKTHLV
ncbi:major facilitator superfamily domain-containing protein [Rhodofomes roseus]|uniref:Major facilitator superfamily domain-containing protein n=1 Tax=Rhodofomes roseus TaxID=34475 RepID=A0ABQ8KQM3_9APHY|nr:major facilitator superfamily domain-containing protein [Rhodofomes roseus]KAH9840918.1 major facilitator superfamily domain-containing protein [Rhodofomes roseus]